MRGSTSLNRFPPIERQPQLLKLFTRKTKGNIMPRTQAQAVRAEMPAEARTPVAQGEASYKANALQPFYTYTAKVLAVNNHAPKEGMTARSTILAALVSRQPTADVGKTVVVEGKERPLNLKPVKERLVNINRPTAEIEPMIQIDGLAAGSNIGFMAKGVHEFDPVNLNPATGQPWDRYLPAKVKDGVEVKAERPIHRLHSFQPETLACLSSGLTAVELVDEDAEMAPAAPAGELVEGNAEALAQA
jgi:hypothetical protein